MHEFCASIYLRRLVVIMVFMVVIAGGLFDGIFERPKAEFADMKVQKIQISVLWTGASSGDCFNEILIHLGDVLKNLKGEKKSEFTINRGVVNLTITFHDDVDLNKKFREVRSLVDSAKVFFPSDALEPQITETDFMQLPLLQFVTTPKDGAYFSRVYLSKNAEEIKKSLQKLPTISEISIKGIQEEEISVILDKDELKKRNIPIGDVVKVIEDNHRVPASGVSVGGESYGVRFSGRITSPEEIKNLKVNGVSILDLASGIEGISLRGERLKGYTTYNGKPSIEFVLFASSNADLLKVAKDARAKIDVEKELYPGLDFDIVFDRSLNFLESFKNLGSAALPSMVIVMIICSMVLGWRLSVFTLLSIPFSFLFADLILALTGNPIVRMVLFSAYLMLPMTMDSTIVVIQRTKAWMRTGKSADDAVDKAAEEVGPPLFAAELTTIAAWSAFVGMSGTTGQFLGKMPIFIIPVIIGIIIYVKIILPGLIPIFVKNVSVGTSENKEETWAVRLYSIVLGFVLRHKISFLALLLCFVTASTMAVKHVSMGWMPHLEGDKVFIKYSLPIGKTLADGEKIEERMHDILLDEKKYPEIIHITSRPEASSAAPSGRVTGDIMVILDKKRARSQSEVVKSLRKETGFMVGLTDRFTLYEGRRGRHSSGMPVDLEIRGEGFEMLKEKALEIKDQISGIPELLDLKTNFEGQTYKEIVIEMNDEWATRYGVSRADVRKTIHSYFFGQEFDTSVNGKSLKIRVRIDDQFETLSDLVKIINRAPIASDVSIEKVANISFAESPASLEGKNYEPVVRLQARLSAEDEVRLGDIQKKIEDKISQIDLPLGYTFGWGGEIEERTETFKNSLPRFIVSVGIILIIVAFVLSPKRESYSLANHIKLVFLTMLPIPLAFLAIPWCLLVHDQPFGLMPGLGIVAALGVVVNDSIVLMREISVNESRMKGKSIMEIAIESCKSRFEAITTTTITTILGLMTLPIALMFGFSKGAESYLSLVLVFIWMEGLSTLLLLFYIPLFECLLSKKRKV